MNDLEIAAQKLSNPTLRSGGYKNASAGAVGGGPNPGFYDPPEAAPTHDFFPNLRRNKAASDARMTEAKGFGETAGATLAGARDIAGGAVMDVNQALIVNPLRGLYDVGRDIVNGARGTNTATAPAPVAPPVAAPSPVVDTAAENIKLQRQNDAPALPGRDVGISGVRRIDTAGKSPEYTNDLGPEGNAFRDAKNPVGVIPGFNIEAANKTAALQREVNGLRAGESDRGNLNFGGGHSEKVAAGYGGDGPRAANYMKGAGEVAQEAAKAQLAGTLRGQDMQAQQHRDTVGASVYGHDLTAANARGLRQFEARKFDIEQQNKGIDQGFRAREIGNTEESNNLAARNAGQKALQERIAAVTPNGADGKPDTTVMAKKTQAVDAYLATQTDLLQKHLKLNPNDKQAASELANIQDRGHSGVGDELFHKLTAGFDVAQIADKAHTGRLNPFGGTTVASNLPSIELTKTEGLIPGFGEYTDQVGRKIPQRYIEGDGSFIGGVRNRSYDSLIKGQK